MFWKNKNKEKNLKGKYIIVHYIDVGNLDTTPMSEERLMQLANMEEYCGLKIKPDMSDADLYLLKYKAAVEIPDIEQYEDIVHELFIPNHGVNDIKIKKFK